MNTEHQHLRSQLITVIGLNLFIIALLAALFIYEQKTGAVTKLSIQLYNTLLKK